jgi:hypothetical protein
MKTSFCALLLIVVLFGCQKATNEKVFVPRTIIAGEDFNTYAKDNETPFTVLTTATDNKETFTIKYRDSLVKIQPNAQDQSNVVGKFSLAQFVNTQKTCLLVQLADSTGLIAPFYLITLKNNQPEVVHLYRPSKGKLDKEITKGMTRVGSTGYLINNDYFITNVNAKVYTIKRQNPEERIQGDFLIKSADKQTFVFLLADAFYQVHYPSNETFTLPISVAVPSSNASLYAWVQANYSWQKNNKGISFLKENKDNNHVVDMRRKL